VISPAVAKARWRERDGTRRPEVSSVQHIEQLRPELQSELPRSCMSFRNERGPGCSAWSLPRFPKGQCRLVANPKVVKRTIVDVFLLIKVRTLDMTTTTQGGCSARTPFYLIS
jgi:hypothetical protein